MGRTACTEPQCLYRGALYLSSRRRVKQDAHLIRPTWSLRSVCSAPITVVHDDICNGLYRVIAIHGTHPPVMSTSGQSANVHPLLSVSPIHLPLSIWSPSHPGDLKPLVQTPGLTTLNLPTDKTCALICYYAVSSGNFLPTFPDDISLPSSDVKNKKEKNILVPCSGVNNSLNMADRSFLVGSWPLKMGEKGRSE